MVIKNAIVNWAFISRPDENGKYRLAFIPSKEQLKLLEDAMEAIAEKNGEAKEKLDWWGSSKETEEGLTFGAKANSEFTSKKGEIIKFTLPVYNKKAEKIEEVPSIKNGAICNIEVEPYFVVYKKKQGVMLQLKSVQLLEYEEYSGGNPYSDETGENPYNLASSDDEKEPWEE